MRIFLPPLEILETEGFTKEKDIFGRAELGKGLTNLVSSVSDPMVIAVDGQWGSGKTVFLKMWAGELRNQGFSVVYFDAFENDYMDDAFLAIAGQIVSLVKKNNAESSVISENIVNRAKAVGRVLLKSGGKVAAKILTANALNAADLTDISDAVTGSTDEFVDSLLDEILTKQSEQQITIHKFKQTLTELPALLQGLKADEDKASTKPLIFIIDELDRCRPHFALQILERMKHFFSVPNVHFVLGVKLSQLANSVVANYGSGIDGQLYLQKFVQLSIQLTDRLERNGETSASKFLRNLTNQSELTGNNSFVVQRCCEELEVITSYRDFSLRTLEQIYGHIVRVIAAATESQFKSAEILTGLSVLKVTTPDLFYEAKRGKLEYHQVMPVLGLIDSDSAIYDSPGNNFEQRLSKQRSLEHWWRYVTDRNCPENIIKSISRSFWSYNFDDRLAIVPWYANEQVDKFNLL
jgi:nucleoside-triphosphatase THEP1